MPTASATEIDPWWKQAVVYQIYPRSFADSDGDGIGDLGGVIQRLDYLAKLGVDVVWLSPIYRSPQDDNGYDISDYQDIDPMFGTLEQFDELLAAAHERGLKIVMDLVVNHTSDEHPWFVESRSSVDNPKRHWYWWRQAREGMAPDDPGAEPTNWGSFFSGSAWQFDEQTGEYYLHLFSRKQPDLNWENPEVRQAVYEMMNWWLDRGVDGFRMDVINMISKKLPLVDGTVHPGSLYGDGSSEYMNGPRVHEFLREMHAAVFAGRPRLITVGETPGTSIEHAVIYTDQAHPEVDMIFQFEHVGLDFDGPKWNIKHLDLRDLKASLGRWQAALAESGWNSLYWNNHDQPRVVSRFGDDGEFRVQSAKLLGTVLHLHRGTPYVYQGEELGMTNTVFESGNDFADIESVNYYREAVGRGRQPDEVLVGLRKMSRDNARTPVQWNAEAQAGFSTGTPWLPVNPNYETVNAADQVDDPDSVFNYYRRLIELRHSEPAVAVGDFHMFLTHDPVIYAFTRTLGNVRLLVVANFSSGNVPVDLSELPDADAWPEAEVLIANYPVEASQSLELRPWEARVYRRAG
jgi:oligo-1,6-glucosidase